ncbi:26893_t:CDS:1, partial [Racocetra persica]
HPKHAYFNPTNNSSSTHPGSTSNLGSLHHNPGCPYPIHHHDYNIINGAA